MFWLRVSQGNSNAVLKMKITIIVYTIQKQKDFTTFTPTKLLFDPGFSVIDAVITKRAEKDYVMVLKDNTRPNRNLKISFAQQPEGPWSPASQAFTESFVEGPTVVQIDTNYLIYFDVYQKKNLWSHAHN